MTTEKASYCQYREQKNARTFAEKLTAFGIEATVRKMNISPAASTAPEDRWCADDYRYAIDFDRQFEPAFLAMRVAAKSVGQRPDEFIVGKNVSEFQAA